MSGTDASACRVTFGRPTRLSAVVGARLLLGAALVVVSSLVATPPVQAHTSLVGMTPIDGSTVSSAPTQVVLTFDEAVEKVGDGVVVTAPSGARVGSGAPVVDGSTLTQQLTPLAEPGRYTVAFRVVSDDGHPVTGTQTFTFAAAGGSPSPATSTPATTPNSSATPTSTSAALKSPADTASAPVVAIVAALLVAAAAAVLVRRRARS